MPEPAATRRSWWGFGAATYALGVLLLGSNLPTPLFPVYAAAFGLSPLDVTLVFATYALVVIPSLLVFGPLADAKGRRTILAGAIVGAAIAAGLFAAANGAAWLFAAEAVQGIALGAIQGSAAPTLIENDPSENRRRASTIASTTTVAGAALGPSIAGLLAEYAVLPRRLPYLVEIGLLAPALAAVLLGLPRDTERKPWRPRRPSVPPEIRRSFVIAGVSAFVAWAVTGLFLSLIPSFVTMTLHDNLAIAGAIAALMLGSSAVAQLAAQRLASLTAQTLGLAVMILGVVGLIVAANGKALPALLAATVLAGTGQGLAFMGSLADINDIAPEQRKGDVVASFFVVVYIGTALPVIGVGILATTSGLLSAIRVFAYIVIAACFAGLAALTRELRRARSTAHR